MGTKANHHGWRLLIAQVATAVFLFATVAQGPMSNIEGPRTVVVRTAAEWRALWNEHDPGHAPPTVDFGQSMVVGVFAGSRPSAGFAVEITGVKTDGDRTIVEYAERQPSRDEFVAQVVTSPFHLVRLMRTAGAVEFRRSGA
jgi:hypothetical protein